MLKKAFDGQNFFEIDNNIKMTDPEIDIDKISTDKNNFEDWARVREIVKK